jgi:integrase
MFRVPRPAYGTAQPFDFYSLRHTAGTLALRQGIPLHTVSKLLGHSDPAMTLRKYAHVLEDMREDAARQWTISSKV